MHNHTRECSDFVSNFRVSNKNSDHMALHASLTCHRPHPKRKEIYVRSLRRIDRNELASGLSAIRINHECSDVDTVVDQYRPISRVVIGREFDYRSRPIYVRYCLTNTTLCL